MIGGPNNCGAEIPKEYLLPEGTNTIEITLCGNPQPKLSYTFHGKIKSAKMIEKLNDTKQMYKYQIDLENVNRNICKSELKLLATGLKNWHHSSVVQVKCKAL